MITNIYIILIILKKIEVYILVKSYNIFFILPPWLRIVRLLIIMFLYLDILNNILKKDITS
jgi:hypothetical protein